MGLGDALRSVLRGLNRTLQQIILGAYHLISLKIKEMITIFGLIEYSSLKVLKLSSLKLS